MPSLFGPEQLRSWVSLANGSAELAVAGRWSSFVLRLVSDGHAVAEVFVNQGRVEPVEEAPVPERTITLRAPHQIWAAFCSAMPARHRHHVLALDKDVPDFQVENRDLLIRHLRVVDLVLEALRDAIRPAEGTPDDE
jgi:diadenosine tetraphosphate (Ap4A) HIT family hydrolase